MNRYVAFPHPLTKEFAELMGSGVVEAACRTVIGRRLKQFGMFSSKRGAEDLLSLRCLVLGSHSRYGLGTLGRSPPQAPRDSPPLVPSRSSFICLR